MALETLLRENGITQAEVGSRLGTTASSVSHKLAGRRPWLQREVDCLLRFLSQRLRRRVRYEDIFPTKGAAA